MKKELSSREDVKLMVDTFYEKVRVNPTLGYIFNEVAKVNWEHHLPVMYSFWSSMMFGEQSYSSNPMSVHIALNKKTPLTENEFSEWIKIFTENVDEHFEGEKAEEIKSRAINIARLMQFKVQEK